MNNKGRQSGTIRVYCLKLLADKLTAGK